MTEYTSAINLAARLIIKKGRVVVFHYRNSAPTDDPNPERPEDIAAPTVVTQDLKMVFIGYEQKAINGTDILTGDQQVYMFAKGTLRAPTKKDLIFEKPVNGGEAWNIIEIETVKPGEEDVLYILQVRR